MRKNVFNFYKKALFTLALAMLINLHLKAQTYCSSNFTSVSFEHITNVTFAGINNTSVGTVGGPVDYTSQVATVNVGVPSTLSVTILADASEYIYAFIDWNQDGDFSDSEEVYTVATSVATSGPFTLAITPPNAATPGTTRMRVMLDFAGSTPNPCKSGTYGEAEDYTVNVVTSPCVAPPTAGNATSSKINACSGENFNLSLTGNSLGSGQTYKWQYSLTGNAPWTDVDTAKISPSYTTTQTASTYYRCMVTCSGNSVYSDSIQVITPALVGGTFTINGALPTGGGNFASFAEAIDYIKCGINAPVVFNVVTSSGPYSIVTPLELTQIYGASSINTITFNGNGETLSYNTIDANNRAAIVLNGADHIIIDSLTIDVSTGTYGYGMVFKSNADSNIIRKSTILNNLTATTTNYAGIVFSSLATSATTAGSNGNDNLIENNRIVGGYYGITIVGAGTTDLDSNNVIRNNSIEEFYAYGIYTLYQKDATIKSNHIHRPTRTNSGSCYGIYSSTGNIGLLIEANKIHNTFAAQTASTSAFYGIYMISDGTAVAPNKIINNLIYTNEGNGTHYGIYNSGGEYMQAYHNTIALDYIGATAGLTYGLYQVTSVPGIEFKNNIVYITRGGSGAKYGIYKSTPATPLVSNNNIFYLGSAGSGAQSIGYQTSAQATLANWQTASSQDAASVVADPLFSNPSVGDYLFTNVSIGNLGAPLGVLKDINDSTRSLSSPDIGAYEYTAPLCVAPPTAGNATSNILNVCTGDNFSLNLTGNSVGTSQTYKWQYSLTGNAPWTDVDTANTTALKPMTQSVSTYYRCAVTCSGITVYSDSLQVITPALVGGTYTINGALPTGGGNFQNFVDAIDYIKCGINAPVVFNVATGSGPYALTSPLELKEVFGVSSTNTITINGNGETLSYNTSDANNRAALVFNGADHIIIDSLTIDVSAGTYGFGMIFNNNADSNIVRKSTILTNTTATTSNYAGIVFSSSPASATTAGSNGNDNLIENNRIVGGYYGITIVGASTTSLDSNNIIRNNSIEEFYLYATYILYQKALVIKSNNIHRPTRTNSSTCYGVYSSTGNIGLLIEANKIHNTFAAQTASTSVFYGVYMTSDGTAASPNKIINNLIYSNEGNGTHYGIYNSGGEYMQAYHNTIALDYTGATAGLTYGFYQVTTGNGIEFKNNIVYITRGGSGAKYGIYKSTPATPLVSNNNIFYLGSGGSGTQSIGYQTSAQATLSDWQTASSQDAASMVADPLFTNPSGGDYLQTESTIDDKGQALGVLTDINGTTRSTTTPDPGAYEQPPSVGIDMKPIVLLTPEVSTGNCYNTETLTVKIGNNSVDSIFFNLKPVTITVNVTGATTATYSATVNTGSLASDSTLNVVMTAPSGTLNMTTAGTYNFEIITTVAGDVNVANDIINTQRTKATLTAGTADATPDTLCAATPINPVLTSTPVEGYNSVRWQISATSGTGFTDIPTANSINYTLPIVPNATYFYRLVATCGSTDVNSTEVQLVYNNPQITTTITDTTCGAGSVTLQATGTGSEISWYANATGGTALSTGNTYTTTISTTDTFYVASGLGASNLTIPGDGAWNHVTTTGGFQVTTITSAYMILNVMQPLTLSSMDIYPSAAIGTAFSIEARTGSATGTTFLSYAGTTTVQNSGSPTVAQTVPVNWQLPIGTYYIGFTSNPNTWRSGLITHTFPWVATGVASMDFYLTPNYQYYFYNLMLSTGCESPRTPVIAVVDNDPGCGVVPVTYTTFTGKKEGMVNMLSWQTATESNNIGFELQRSSDGKQFSKLSFVNSKAINGNSTSNLSYGYNDVKPLAGTNYYRLKQVDKDGKFNYSTVVILKGDKVSQISIASVYPNPVRNTINVQIVSPANEKVSLVITDITGKVLMQENTSLTAGDNVKQIDVSRLSQGAYLIKAICNNGCETAVFKFTKY